MVAWDTNAKVTVPYVQTHTMDSQAPSQYTSDGPTSSASSRHHTYQYNTHNHNLPLTFSSPSAAYSSSPTTSAFSGVVHQQRPGPGQWGQNSTTTHRSGATARDEVLPPPAHLPHQPQQQGTKSLKRDLTSGMSQQQPNTKVESSSTNGHGQHHASDDPMPSTSDFVKKLYKCVSPVLPLFGGGGA